MRDDGVWRWVAAGSDERCGVAAFQLSPCHRKHNLPDQLRARPSSDRSGIAWSSRADDLTGIADLEVDVWVVLRWFIPNALELAAANAHDRHPDFIMKLRITFHLQRAAYTKSH